MPDRLLFYAPVFLFAPLVNTDYFFIMPSTALARVTQRDIAKALNVSQTSVAFALGAKYQGRLSSDVESLIRAKAAELRYRPNQLARAFRRKRSHTIAVVFTSSAYQAPQDRVKLLAQNALAVGYRLLAVDLSWFGSDAKVAQEYLLDSTAEGIVFCNIQSDSSASWEAFLRECPIPCVALSSGFSNSTNQTQADIRGAFRQMTRHHLQIGARRPMLLCSYRDGDYRGPIGSSIRDRMEGFAEAIREVGGRLTAGKFLRTRFPGLDDSCANPAPGALVGTMVYPEKPAEVTNAFELGFQQVGRLLAKDALPDSLICSNDEIAAGALAACVRHQISVPDTLRISGSDDAAFSRFAAIPLTTISQPSTPMAEWCIRRITRLIETPGASRSPRQKIFPCEILPRQSTTGIPALS